MKRKIANDMDDPIQWVWRVDVIVVDNHTV